MITLLVAVFFAGFALLPVGYYVSGKKLLLGSILLGIAISCVLSSLVILKLTSPKQNSAFKPEYELEILNQDSVAVKSLSTGITYKVRFDQVHEALLKDNL